MKVITNKNSIDELLSLRKDVYTKKELNNVLDTLFSFVDELQFDSNKFETYNNWLIIDNSKYRADLFFYTIFAYTQLKNKKLSNRLSIKISDTSLQLLLDKDDIGYLNFRQHSYRIDDYPNHWFNTTSETDIKYVLKSIIKYNFGTGKDLNEVLKKLHSVIYDTIKRR